MYGTNSQHDLFQLLEFHIHTYMPIRCMQGAVHLQLESGTWQPTCGGLTLPSYHHKSSWPVVLIESHCLRTYLDPPGLI